jgi:putative pyoverdin transport system ATP-binding/permease protein
MVSLLWYVCRLSSAALLGSVTASFFAAGANVLLMAVIVSMVRQSGSISGELASFGALCVLLLIARTASQLFLMRQTHNTVYELQTRISQQIAAMPQRRLEQLGAPALLAVVSDDVSVISGLGLQIPELLMNICILGGILSYVCYVSRGAFCLLIAMVAVGMAGHKILAKDTRKLMKTYREEQASVFESISDLLLASKELRHNVRKHLRLVSGVETHANEARRTGYVAWRQYSFAAGWAYTAYFGVIGLIVACSQTHMFGLTSRDALLAVFSVLFMKGAIEALFGVVPALRRAEIAFKRIEETGLELKNGEDPYADPECELLLRKPAFERIQFRNVSYIYDAAGGGCNFQLGPLSLEVHRGEILFISGCNGAGKTSLLKLMSGLYAPTSGLISVDGVPVRSKDIARYRQLFSSVFHDFHLLRTFDEADKNCLDQAREYLEEFQLGDRVTVDDKGYCFGTVSRGQQKRLALAIALLEDKPICVLDEWAADQDPEFRAYFYERLLPRMRSEGRTVIAVTHDDAWHHAADRVLWLSDGILYNRPMHSRVGPRAVAGSRNK